jgi:hypothetical protein
MPGRISSSLGTYWSVLFVFEASGYDWQLLAATGLLYG